MSLLLKQGRQAPNLRAEHRGKIAIADALTYKRPRDSDLASQTMWLRISWRCRPDAGYGKLVLFSRNKRLQIYALE